MSKIDTESRSAAEKKLQYILMRVRVGVIKLNKN